MAKQNEREREKNDMSPSQSRIALQKKEEEAAETQETPSSHKYGEVGILYHICIANWQ